MKKVYSKRGFQVKHISMDGKFEWLREILTGQGVNPIICPKDEHIGDIEHLKHIIQEGVRSAYTALPYERMPGRM
eukprot:9058436-Ditylum_brightwellii.AAC.1